MTTKQLCVIMYALKRTISKNEDFLNSISTDDKYKELIEMTYRDIDDLKDCLLAIGDELDRQKKE